MARENMVAKSCSRFVQGGRMSSVLVCSPAQQAILTPRHFSTTTQARLQQPAAPFHSRGLSFRPASCLVHRQYATVADNTPSIMVNDLHHQEILVNFSDNHTVRYSSFWLRDHCRCSDCLHPHTQQRQISTFELDPDIQATHAGATAQGLEVTWSQNEHKSLYPWDWLSRHIPFNAATTIKHPRQDAAHVSPATTEQISVEFGSIMKTDPGLQEFLQNIRTAGFSFIANTPSTPEATERLLQRISFIRPTQYGAFWDFTSEQKPVDTAYTNVSLGLHTDTTYFTDPAGLQLFHCLQPATNGGGQSTFSDGFAAAHQLYKINPDYYNILSSVRIVSHASGSSEKFGAFMNNAAHAGGFPVFTHSVPHVRPHPKNLTQIRWNNDDRHSSTQWPSHERMIMWYRAARVWQELLASKEFQWETQLQPGNPVIFDNWRILHGRRAFEGQRRVCGGYIGMDEFLARGRMVDAVLAAEQGADVEEGKARSEDKHNGEQIKEEQIKKEQIEEEKSEGMKKEEVEPDVLPQKEEGVDRPIAS